MIDKIIEQEETIKGMQQNEDSAIKIMKMYEDYKLRVDKAIEYIEEKYITFFDNVNPLILLDKEDFNKILNILKGE